ncbi:MAG TPA: hypothetical protein IAB04_07235 [Candidatus Avimonoglobus intestinipullorum]|uniref:Uncharacterized protein n=1 Tax=Candidatus Avimonoglobus intestinipullorum TaxID=2840699 RepID=A0A9D1LW26_9FIRM|nr:hypothetical protein [Candidatus Avimonoglobus intestinipullorum]
MLKKLLSGILCVGMLMGAAVMPASAEMVTTPLPGWPASFCEIPEGVEQGDLGVEIITDPEFVQSGEKALHVFGKQDLDGYNVQAVQNIAALEQGKTYRLTGKFWVSRNTWRVRLVFGNKKLEQLGNIVGELNTWCDAEYTFEYDAAKFENSKDFKIQVAGNGEVYADNLSLKEVLYDTDGETVIGYGEELLQNGDFEESSPQPAEADFVNVAARNGANFIAVKTTAPETAIYAVGSDGILSALELEPVLSNPTYNLNVYAHTGLTNDTEYSYVVKTVNEYGEESDGITVSGTPSAAYDDYIKLNSWQYKHYGNNAGGVSGSNFGTADIKNGIGVDGSAALYLTNMTDSSTPGDYLYVTNGSFKFETGKTYKLSYWQKNGAHNTREDSMGVRFSKGKISFDGGKTYSDEGKDGRPAVIPDDGQWHEQVAYVTATGEKSNMEIRLYRHFESLILDNFTMYEVDSNLEVVPGAQNLFAELNGDFEEGIEDGTMTCTFNFYSAYETGEIMDPTPISALSDLAMYETDYLHTEAAIKNSAYADGKAFEFYLALYKDGALYDLKKLDATAAYVPTSSDGETYGITCRIPALDTGVYEVRAIVLDGTDTMTPLCEAGVLAE